VIQNSFLRWTISLFLGILTTLISFFFMNYMINSDDNRVGQSSVYKLIDFVSLSKEIEEPEIKKELPPEPQKQKEPPKVPSKVQKSQKNDEVHNQAPVNLDMPTLSGNIKSSMGSPKILAPMKTVKIDSALTPMVQIRPTYPSREKRMGVEGYVKARLEVDATGRVISVQIVESKPKGAFDKSVKKALKKWKFRPKTVDGKAVPQTGELRLNFKLGNR